MARPESIRTIAIIGFAFGVTTLGFACGVSFTGWLTGHTEGWQVVLIFLALLLGFALLALIYGPNVLGGPESAPTTRADEIREAFLICCRRHLRMRAISSFLIAMVAAFVVVVMIVTLGAYHVGACRRGDHALRLGGAMLLAGCSQRGLRYD